MTVVWVYIDPSRQYPWCALRKAYPGGRIITHCLFAIAYEPVFVATQNPTGLECRACLREIARAEQEACDMWFDVGGEA